MTICQATCFLVWVHQVTKWKMVNWIYIFKSQGQARVWEHGVWAAGTGVGIGGRWCKADCVKLSIVRGCRACKVNLAMFGKVISSDHGLLIEQAALLQGRIDCQASKWEDCSADWVGGPPVGLPLRLPHDGAFFVGNFDQTRSWTRTIRSSFKTRPWAYFGLVKHDARLGWFWTDFYIPNFLGMERGLITTPIMVLSKGPATPTSRSDRDSTRLWTFAMEICSGCVLLTKFTVWDFFFETKRLAMCSRCRAPCQEAW